MKKFVGLISINLLAISGYFLLALLAKEAFAWQSTAITLWPASGLANALLISHGWIVLPGLAIGNFLGTAFDPNAGFSFQPFMLPVAIAASAQAGFVRWMLIRKNLLNDPLTRISRLTTFLLIIGPLGNWPAAATFLFYRIANSSNLKITNFALLDSSYVNGAFFWWLGDSLGSLLLVPLLLLLLPFRRPIWLERRTYLLRPLLAMIALLITGSFIERILLERIDITPQMLEPLQGLRLLSTFAWIVVALGVLGLILQISGKYLEQEKLLSRSRLAGDAAGAVIHEIGQPLIRLRLRLERIVTSLEKNINAPSDFSSSYSELKSQAEQSLDELNSVVLNTRSIQDLTLAGIRDSNSADLKDAIATSSTQLRQELDRLDQDLNISIENELPQVSAGQIQLQAAIRNLLSNAIKAAGENGVIRIYVRYFSNYVYCEIEDSGSGFDPLCVPDGKKRFKSHSNGMGLGLMIVRRVIDDNGGKIQFTNSQELGGAKVKIWLKPN
ncbi:Membrane associated sensory histidine kinase [Prochlorococcus sp. MIT 0602]|uniref:sensor histidine kinase n=1 Tax=unclassified Prochlorococcus TaxID=2627481 RepID=UPI0005338C94|nr:Membrane associated sensory histidine kinase [Prochlorococcus sp. MIT 0602]KGG15711.1 Membrane associated sensory histidine kinase [Prochlorococcus sp. MIT 0603]